MEQKADPSPAPLLVLTGGGGSLAGVIAQRFRDGGWRVEAPARREMDVSQPEQVRQWFATQEPPDLLICAAGSTRDRLLARLDEADWDRVIGDNLAGAANCARMVSKAMLRRRRGHIIFISSYSALHPAAGQAAYAAAKAGLLGLARSLAKELGPAGIRVNTVLPGFLETKMTAEVPADRLNTVRADHVLNRFNGVKQVADFLFFLQQSLPHTSGQMFSLDSR